jgi:hypothetical protein
MGCRFALCSFCELSLPIGAQEAGLYGLGSKK